MTKRQIALSRIAAGDVFHAVSPGGLSVICVALAVTARRIRARDICRQGEELAFDRQTGVSARRKTLFSCTIDSTARLPLEFHEALVRLDAKYNSGRVLTEEDYKVTEIELRAFCFVYDYYPANPI